MENQLPKLDPQVAWAALLVFVGYYLGAKIGFALTFHPHPVSVLWPPNAILLAALLITPRRAWWMLMLAAFPAHWLAQLQSGVSPPMIICWFISNCFEAAVGAGGIRYLVGHGRLDRLRNVAIFCVCGVFLGPFLSSFLDSAFVAMNHWGAGSYWEIWRIRFTSNGLAALTIAPFLVTWATGGVAAYRRISRRRLLEGACLLFGLSVVSFVLFNKLPAGAYSALLYMPLPFLLWAAVRFGSFGATTANAAVAFLAIWGASRAHGPFSGSSPEENALYVQFFLIFMSVPLLFLAALIEERNRVEETLREREERIELAAGSANLAFWTMDFERRESWMSKMGRELFGFAPEEPLSRELFLARVHPEDREAVNDALEQAFASSQSFEIECRLLRPDAETRWLIARGRYLRNDCDEATELIAVAIDVSGQVRANLELRRQHDEMARLSRVALMGELAASLAHELNQPLTAIASNAAAGKRFLARGSQDRHLFQELLADIVTDACRAGDVVHGIHHLVRKREGSRCPVNLNDTIREVLRLLHSDLLGRATSVETEFAPGLFSIEADPVHLQQVVLNLIMNSLEAMHETPVSQRRILVSTSMGGRYVRVDVRDHGVGVPREDPERIFAPFFSTKPNGMGMGLTIVRSIIEAHGGELVAETADEGAHFFFRLPMVEGLKEENP